MIEYPGDDMYMTEEDEKDWGDGVEMMEYEDDVEAESDVDEQDDEEEDERIFLSYYQQAQYTQNTTLPVRCHEVHSSISPDHEPSRGSIIGFGIRRKRVNH